MGIVGMICPSPELKSKKLNVFTVMLALSYCIYKFVTSPLFFYFAKSFFYHEWILKLSIFLYLSSGDTTFF
jgi:hypothetical protein